MNRIWINIIVLLFSNIVRIDSIQTRIHRPIRFIDERALPTRHFRHVDSDSEYGVYFDWEHGLKEATLQALFREHFRDANLKKHIYSAPLLGKQNKATPFGDIAILARGQLYANYAGFIFVQDPYQNDCDDCHNIDKTDTNRRRCITNHCQIWHPKNNEKLVALWSIKRIRHRSRQDSSKYEVEFTISPVGVRHPSDGYLTNEGTFNYNLPAHVFILKSGGETTRQNLKKDRHHIDHLGQGAFIAQTPDGSKYTLHSFHGLLAPDTPRYYDDLPQRYHPLFTSTSSTTEPLEEEEKKVYQTLLEVLHKKTSPESMRFTTSSKTSTTVSGVQLPTGQFISITEELETPFIAKTTPGYVTVRFPQNPGGERVTEVQTIGIPSSSKVMPQSFGIMRPQTTPVHTPQLMTTVRVQETTIAEPHTTVNEIFQTPGVVGTKPGPFYTTPTTENNNQMEEIFGNSESMVAPMTTKQPPFKMTVHFFAAAEEAKKTTPELKPLTTTQQYENFLPDTLLSPTEPTIAFVSAESITEAAQTTTILQETTNDPTLKATKRTFITKTESANYRPAMVVRVTKPVNEETTRYFSTFTTSKTLDQSRTTESFTKTVPSIVLEPSSTHLATSKEIHTFTAPIKVLETSTVASILEETSKFPTSQQFEQVFTFTQPPPKTTYTPPQYHVLNSDEANYSTTQFYNMSKPNSMEEETTSQVSITKNIETEQPNKDALSLETTTYTKIPKLEPGNGLLESTFGVTKATGISRNKTTEMVYYTTEESSEVPVKKTTETAPSNFVQSSRHSVPRTTEPTIASATIPKRIVTTIRADGTVSVVKTTPISADEELFGVTKSSTKKDRDTKPPKIGTTSGSGDFLVDAGSLPDYKVPLFKKPLKDYSEDDIFGPTKGIPKKKTSNQASAAKHYTKSDLEQALFDTNKRKSKALIRRKSSSTKAPVNIVNSDIFEASISAIKTSVHDTSTLANGVVTISVKTTNVSNVATGDDTGFRNAYSLAYLKRKASPITTETVPIATTMADYGAYANVSPVTSQSYLTSISYEVNKKRKRPFDDQLRNDTEKHQNINKKYKKKVNGLSTELGDTTNMMDTSLENDFALRLVAHAKGVEYLERVGRTTTAASTLASTSAKTTKKSKYTRRRSYTPKAKRPTPPPPPRRKQLTTSKEI